MSQVLAQSSVCASPHVCEIDPAPVCWLSSNVGNMPNSLFDNTLIVGFVPITMKCRGGQQARMPGTLWLVVFCFFDLQVGDFPWRSMPLSPANTSAHSTTVLD